MCRVRGGYQLSARGASKREPVMPRLRGRKILGARHARMIRCYITDRRNCRGNLLDNIERVAADGIEMIQIREKDLESRQLAELTRAAVLRTQRFSVKIIVNGRADVAIGAGAHGIHLPSHSIPPLVWKQVWPELTVGISCHTFPDLSGAEGADYAFFSPVFDSPGKADARGLQDLAHA